MSESKRDQFKEIAKSTEWKDIESLISAFDESDYWDEDFYQKSEREAKAHYIRKMMRSFKDDTGFPEFASVEITLPDGKSSRIYKQLEMFDQADFGKARTYCMSKLRHFKYLYDGYTEREKQRFGTQMTLLYPETSDQPTLEPIS